MRLALLIYKVCYLPYAVGPLSVLTVCTLSCLLRWCIVAKSFMDQDVTWYGARPRPKPHRVRWGPSSPPRKNRGHNPQFLAHVCCGQTAGRTNKMSLGREVGLVPGDIVLDREPPPLKKEGHSSPTFRPMSIVAKLLDRSRCQW